MLAHRLAQRECGAQVVLVILDRLLCGFPDRLVAREVNDGVDLVFT